MVRSESVRDNGRERSTRAAPKRRRNGGWLQRGHRQSWRLQERPEKKGFFTVALKKWNWGLREVSWRDLEPDGRQARRLGLERLQEVWEHKRPPARNRKVGKEKVKSRFSGTQHYRSTGDFRNGQHRVREGSEHKEQALTEGRQVSGAAGSDSRLLMGENRAWVRQSRAAICHHQCQAQQRARNSLGTQG